MEKFRRPCSTPQCHVCPFLTGCPSSSAQSTICHDWLCWRHKYTLNHNGYSSFMSSCPQASCAPKQPRCGDSTEAIVTSTAQVLFPCTSVSGRCYHLSSSGDQCRFSSRQCKQRHNHARRRRGATEILCVLWQVPCIRILFAMWQTTADRRCLPSASE